jgi:hypothetical protein
LVEGVVALGVDKAGVPQQIEGIALGEEVTPQVPAGGITDLQLPDQSGVMESTLFQIPSRLWAVIELLLIESGSLPQHGGGVRPRALLFEVGEALAEGEVLGQLHKANQIAALTATMAVKEILAGIDIKGRPSLQVQGTESHELVASTHWAGDPILAS